MKEITLNIVANNKSDYRRQLITVFLDEECGSRDHTTYYKYYVDVLNDGNRIYLQRPTQLNKGVDFEVRVENVNFRYGRYGNIISTGNRPSHLDIITDLRNKRQENIAQYQLILRLVERVYNCEHIEDTELVQYVFNTGFSVELIIKVLKWLFIEQDITYWNKSGREMLYRGILDIE